MGQSSGVAESSCAKGSDKDAKRAKSGTKGSAPLGIQTKKTEFLRWGSPRLRSTKLSRHISTGEEEKKRCLRRDSKRSRVGTTSDGVMDSKNPSKKHLSRRSVGTVEGLETTLQFDALRRCVRSIAQD